MLQENPVTTQACPECDNQVEVHKGFIKWCSQCNWNLDPQILEPKNIIESSYVRLGIHQSTRLFEQMLKADSLQPSLTPFKLLAYSLATTVHLFSITVLVIGIWLVVIYWPYLGIAIGILFILIALTTRPRFEKWPDKVYTREELPTLLFHGELLAVAVPETTTVKISK